MTEIELKTMELKHTIQELNLKRIALLHKKMSIATSRMSHMMEDGENKFAKFKYVTYNQMFEKLSTILQEEGLSMIPEISEASSEAKQGKKSINNFVTLVGVIEITDVDTGYQIKKRWVAEGYDAGDKAMYKAETYLMKTFIQSTFLVASGEDPDGKVAGNRPTGSPNYNTNSNSYNNRKQGSNQPKTSKKELKFDPNITFRNQLASLINDKILTQDIIKDVLESEGYSFSDVVNIKGKEAEEMFNLILKEV